MAGTTEETQATLLLKRRKDMRMVDEALEAVKQQFKLRMERLAERQALFEEVSVGCDPGYCVMYSSPPWALPQKQKALQDMVAKFKPFIEEVGLSDSHLLNPPCAGPVLPCIRMTRSESAHS